MARRTRIVLAASVTAVLAVGAGTAYSASSSSSGQSFLDDFARHLGVSSDKVQSAWLATVSDQLQQAVKDGRLTQAQADRIIAQVKAHGPSAGPGGWAPFPGPMDDGDGHGPPPFGHGPPPWAGPNHGFDHGPVVRPDGGMFGAAAKYLGVSPQKLFSQMQNGSTPAAVAKQQGKSVSGLENAMLKAVHDDLDQAVNAGRLSAKQASKIASGVSKHIDDIVRHGFRHDDDHDHPAPSSTTTAWPSA